MPTSKFRAFFVYEQGKDAEEATEEAEEDVREAIENSDVANYEIELIHEPHDVAREVDPKVDFAVDYNAKDELHQYLFKNSNGYDHLAERQ